MRAYLGIFSGLWIGCSPGFNPNGSVKTESLNNPTGNEDDALSTLESEAGLNSLANDMDPSYCEGMQPDVAGASSYFYGVYLKDADGWYGEEQWILHPTDSWNATDGETCYVTWSIAATETTVTGCPSCNLALNVSGSINRQETTCPEGLWDNPSDSQWSTTYNILIGGGNSIVYFQSDGEIVGEGYATTSAFNFLSDVSCTWF